MQVAHGSFAQNVFACPESNRDEEDAFRLWNPWFLYLNCIGLGTHRSVMVFIGLTWNNSRYYFDLLMFYPVMGSFATKYCRFESRICCNARDERVHVKAKWMNLACQKEKNNNFACSLIICKPFGLSVERFKKFTVSFHSAFQSYEHVYSNHLRRRRCHMCSKMFQTDFIDQ